MKKIIVTGYSGFIGTLLTSLLEKKGYQVVGIDTDYYDRSCRLYPETFSSVNKIKKDVRDIDQKDIDGAYAICHLAALSNDPIGELDKELTHEINYQASLRLAKLAKKALVEKFIYSSSCSMYGIAGDEALTEEDRLEPITAYAESKVLSEKNIMPLKSKNFSVTSLRNATAYGISPKLRVDLVVNNLVGWAMVTGQIRIMSDGTPWRPLMHAEDIARAFIAVIEAPKEKVNGESFNVGLDSENHRIKDIAYLIKKVMPECGVIITGEHGKDSRTYKVDFGKIKRELPNFKPTWNLKKGIEELCEFYSKYKIDLEKFNGRYFIRLKQIKHLLKSNKVSPKLYWR